MMDADNADDLANKLAQTESRLHCLEKAAGDIGSYMNANKVESLRLNQTSHLHPKWQASGISRPIHIPQQQHFIY